MSGGNQPYQRDVAQKRMGIMRIEDLPRPWLLAAMTGVSVSALLERAERERAEEAEAARHSAVLEYQRARPPGSEQRAAHRPAVRVEFRQLAS
jgi:hypothetical protein